jgi:CBS domain-containing protein
MRVNEIMSTSLATVAANTPADAAWETMRGRRIHHLVVMDGKLIAGILSDRDAGGVRGKAVRAGHSVGELMTPHVVTVPADAPLKRAANLMRGRTIGCVIVVDKQRPIGIVTTSDLLELLGRGAIKPSPVSKRAPLNYRAPHKKRHRAFGVW